MDTISIRRATDRDKGKVAALLADMLAEMAEHGGYAVADRDVRRASLERVVSEGLVSEDAHYVVAECGAGSIVGAANARIVPIADVFVPLRSLHVSTVYVTSAHRRTGIATRLLEALLEWGRESACPEADLNVLTSNPARALYERMGFGEVQRKLVKRL